MGVNDHPGAGRERECREDVSAMRLPQNSLLPNSSQDSTHSIRITLVVIGFGAHSVEMKKAE